MPHAFPTWLDSCLQTGLVRCSAPVARSGSHCATLGPRDSLSDPDDLAPGSAAGGGLEHEMVQIAVLLHHQVMDGAAFGKHRLDAGDGGADTAHHAVGAQEQVRSEEHTSELQSLMRISYAVFCLTKKKSIDKKYKI